MKTSLLLLLLATTLWSLSAEKPIVPEPTDDDIPHSLHILQYSEGVELLRKTTHFTDTSLYFLRLISNDQERKKHSAIWVHSCKKTYSLLNILHHQSNFWLSQAASLPAKGMALSKQVWNELAQLATVVQQQEQFLASLKKKQYLHLIAQTEFEILRTQKNSFIQSRERSYKEPLRWQREFVTPAHTHR